MSFPSGTVLSGPGMKPRFMGKKRKGPLPVVIKSSKGQLGRKVKGLDKRVKKLQRHEELKHNDVILTNSEITNTGVFTLLNGVANGNTNITRVGNDGYATSLQARMIINNDSLVGNGQIVRFILFWDQQPNGAAPALADLLDISVLTNPINSPYNRDNQKRFKILVDKTVTLNPTLALTVTTGATDTVATVSIIQKSIKFKRKLFRTVKYDGTTAGIADIESNSLYIMYVSGSASNTPSVSAGFRYYFKDS